MPLANIFQKYNDATLMMAIHSQVIALARMVQATKFVWNYVVNKFIISCKQVHYCSLFLVNKFIISLRGRSILNHGPQSKTCLHFTVFPKSKPQSRELGGNCTTEFQNGSTVELKYTMCSKARNLLALRSAFYYLSRILQTAFATFFSDELLTIFYAVWVE